LVSSILAITIILELGLATIPMLVGKSARLMVALMAAESLTEMVVQLVLISVAIIHVSVTVTVISVSTGARGA
jgi:ABC-type transport system involved in cytochrome c biogenesis permease subunit